MQGKLDRDQWQMRGSTLARRKQRSRRLARNQRGDAAMTRFDSSADLFVGGILTGIILVALTAAATAQAAPPDFSSNTTA